MRLFEAILDANHCAVAGDTDANLHPAEFADDLAFRSLLAYTESAHEKRIT